MSIGPLGEESGSKSTCYYVIFDQHLVVKIPPKPIRHFEDYVAGLKKERHIVERLAPRECIVPTVSVILDRVHPIPAGAGPDAEAREETHIAWLRQTPVSQEHLKINGSFAYFMDLSQHRFLGHIIDALHDVSEAVRTEINAAPDIIRHPGKFKDRYVSENESVGFEIRDLYNQCEAEISRQLKQQGHSALISPYRIQKWFLQYLETRRMGDLGKEISTELAASIGYVFDAHFQKFQSSVDAFHAAVRRYAARLALEQNLPVVSGIITHLLGLLGDLYAKRVALRDLKPDNMLVAGDPERYPAFLRSPRDYSLGIIDVETGVYYGGDGEGKVRQPLLGGTPYYATPSHLMPNTVIQHCFGDPGRILHFQDWQAVIVMIYRTVTGELLFDRTAQQFVEIKAEVLRALKEHRPLEEIVAELSRGFWQYAVEEFRSGMRSREEALRQVEVEIPSGARRLFQKAVQRDAASVAEAIRRLVSSQPHVPSEAGRDQLLKCTHAQICRFMQDIEFRAKAGALSADSAQRALQCFKKLINLKALHERKAHLCTLLEADPARLNTYDLLMFMFNLVLKAMYREDWKPLAEEPAAVTCRPDDELSLSTTV
jgi:serine/threonine protein kinase